MKKIEWKSFIICLAIPLLLVGGVNSLLLTNLAAPIYNSFILPPLAPPVLIFSIVWTALYALMGFASYLVWNSVNEYRLLSLGLYAISLMLNFAWTMVFFRLQLHSLAVLVIIALLFVIGWTIQSFAKVNKTASNLMIPYFIWVSFATYLNVSIALIN